MPSRPTTTVEEMRRVMMNLALAAAPAGRSSRSAERRQVITRAVTEANEVLNAELILPQPEACQHCLRRLAEAADAEARERPGFRCDIEG
ncbi:hypothetical protein [Minwuia thermotolerans]|uniref:Uncharacterized protein n=1 Tax=Minwuia thermotolerans TaxID=2056226 RepID=A0A2M9G0S1_9PROT|nr:hypothetical protein [Minwuia thermotolerans]PJK29312.1 hypothetical protein CVT23_11960 [Minwuia thermotolerans]PJK30503.1 hypothetical protein CVT23_06035 [Minwuia thermotolerans]PJK30726.1 hypothetical protein CVT23_04985 [Minwuia thermotolerans]